MGCGEHGGRWTVVEGKGGWGRGSMDCGEHGGR
jgi:hypothetical protein